jgi:hypothetical protein
MTLSNQERTVRCQQAIIAYSDDEAFAGLVDLLADARHWCGKKALSYADFDRTAYQHYRDELNYQHIDERKLP